MSSVVPSDSASSAGRKKKPGKAERAARRSAVSSAPGAPASNQKAAAFAAATSSFDVRPQPGKFPVVFATGAGEPSRDMKFSVRPRVVASGLSSFLPAFKDNPRYSEFLTFTEYTDADFSRQLSVAALLRLAQQIVAAHVNMGLPQGDFSPLSSTEVRLPASVSAFLSQFGEMSVPSIGTRLLLANYTSTVHSLVLAADRLTQGGSVQQTAERLWLPMSSRDTRTRAIVAGQIWDLSNQAGLSIPRSDLEDAVLSGNHPDFWDTVVEQLEADPARRPEWNFLFQTQADVGQFATNWTTANATRVLGKLGLEWPNPSAGHLDWQFSAKTVFSELADQWAQKSAAYAQFFEMTSSAASKPTAAGSLSQFAAVSTNDSVTVIKTFLALSAPEFSLAACFPSTGFIHADVPHNVVVTTPLSVRQKTTEFIQMDWR
ncbi:capsid protein [Ophiostoma partitivirus 1]|uniref:Capsid protein n=1 Tax=Ophiostoma partitivirus 1 TaxID=347482 RepID=Q18L81_9VIRU|nr:capsid protein [Ophiostoma partitivirus 1]CAJ31887.1 capsid protein [Ophiostoma partitivirus 1]